jgi:general secretion pathway protein D
MKRGASFGFRLSLGWALALGAPAFGQGGPPAAPAAAVDFSFDQAELRILVKLVGEITGRRFVVDDKAEGKITVVSPAKVPVDQVYPLFLSILEARGFSVLEREGTCFVVALPAERGVLEAPVSAGGGAAPGGVVTRLFALKHIGAVEAAKLFETMVRGGKAGAVAAFGPTNHLLVTDTAGNVERVARILEELDRPGSARTIEVVTLQHASAEDLAAQVMAAVLGSRTAGARVSAHLRQVGEGAAALPSESMAIPSAHANSLVLVGTPVQLAEMKAVIEKLDVDPAGGRGGMNAVFLKYLSAEEAAKSLNALLAKTAEKDRPPRIAIEPSVANNALLIDASPRDTQWLGELIEQLDRPPQQVLVEVLIAEMTVGRQLDLGVEWSTIESPENGVSTALGRSRPGEVDVLGTALTTGVFPQGLTVGVARGLNADGQPLVPFLLTALQQNRDVRILASVPLWAQNNAEASASVVENIPVLKSTIEGGSGTARDVIQNIERQDVGVKLKVTPHVNANREITMQLNPSIEAVIDEGPAETPFTPTIARRELTTKVTVPDEATIVLSGLIREDRIRERDSIPLLGDIPLLGSLFRYTADRTQRSNLLIFVTPHIVDDLAKADALRQSLEARAGQPQRADGALERGK